MLKDVFDIAGNKEFFRLKGSAADRDYLQKMMMLLIHTKTGRELLFDIGRHSKLPRKGPVKLKMVHGNENETLGVTYETLDVEIVRIDTAYMTKKQQEKILVQQSITLGHELTHILQFLNGANDVESSFSIPHRVYAHVLDEVEASLTERAMENELNQMYPGLLQGMRLWQHRFPKRQQMVRAILGAHHYSSETLWGIDTFIDMLKNENSVVGTNVFERSYFRRWVDMRLMRMNTSLRYKDMPLGRVSWYEQLENNSAVIWGNDSFVVTDRVGGLLARGYRRMDREKNLMNVIMYAQNDRQSHFLKSFIEMHYEHSKIHHKKPLMIKPFRTKALFNAVGQQQDRFGK